MRCINVKKLIAAFCIWIASGFPIHAVDHFIPPKESDGTHDAALRSYEEGYSHYRSGLFNEAIQAFLTALKHEPNLIKAHYWLGKSYREMGYLEEAKFHWEEVLRLKRLITGRRIALMISDNEYPAETQILSTIQRKDDADREFRKAKQLLEDGHWSGAVAQAKQAVELYPAKYEYLLFLARALWDTNDRQGSAKTYSDILMLNEPDFGVKLEAVDRLCKTGHTETALAELKIMATTHPDNPQILNHIKLIETTIRPGVTAIGKVVRKLNGQVIINIGLDSGLKLADEYTLRLRSFRPGEAMLDPDTGKIFGREPDSSSGELLITKVFSESSWALIRKEFGLGIKPGDLIEVTKSER